MIKFNFMRPIWKGIISFGLINIPVKLYNATQEKSFDFHFLSKKDMCPIKYKKVCGTTGSEVPFKDIVRGFQFKKGSFIIVDDEDLKKVAVKRSQLIEVIEFVDKDDIDWKYLEKPFYIEPDRGAQKSYALLRETLKKTKKAGLAKFVMHTREYFVAITVDGNLLVLNQLRFNDQLRSTADLDLPKKSQFTHKELSIATMLIEELAAPFAPEKYKDTYASELKRLVSKKIKGQPIRIKPVAMPQPTLIPDIMIRLKESLEYAKRQK